ncbi:hypothetical protein ACNKHM_22760 [Shigella sonnei]
MICWMCSLFLIISLIIGSTIPSPLRNDVKTSASVRSPWCSSTRVCSCGGGDERSYSDGGAVSR